MKKVVELLVILVFLSLTLVYQMVIDPRFREDDSNGLPAKVEHSYWLLLQRKSNLEKLYLGLPGDESSSALIRIFRVKTGVPGERPTPLPQLLGREYWIVNGKFDTPDNPETAPYFLSLDIPLSEEEPYGPSPYPECEGKCNWILPGAFGLHGVAGNPTKLTEDNPGSSGCIRHSDEDITYLYNLLDSQREETRYYIRDV